MIKKSLLSLFFLINYNIFSQIDSCLEVTINNLQNKKNQLNYTCLSIEIEQLYLFENKKQNYFFPYVNTLYLYGLKNNFLPTEIKLGNKIENLYIESITNGFKFKFVEFSKYNSIKFLKIPLIDSQSLSEIDSLNNLKELYILSDEKTGYIRINNFKFYQNLRGLILSIPEYDFFDLSTISSNFIDSVSLDVKSVKKGSKIDFEKFQHLQVLQFNSLNKINFDTIFTNVDKSNLTCLYSFNELNIFPECLMKFKHLKSINLNFTDLDMIIKSILKLNPQIELNISTHKISIANKNKIESHFKLSHINLLK
ncbi:MAG TPA: hypothetical protein VK835_14800 [Bacteroidia bacterium]|jgi:hypothetical protein|nr:hypothetical protein [Bacteroidia bacterium]